MTPERYQQVGEIFHAASGLDEEERSRFLAEACGGDEELGKEVESLLREADENRSSFLGSPAVEVLAKSMAEHRANSLTGQTLGNYRIAALLGAGGMGEVYRAHDTRLQRDVAVKVLPAGVFTNAERMRRFEQEARSAGALNHPNILTIHEIGVHDGSLFIVSELLEGETLRTRLGRPIALAKAIEFALGIGRGLAAAHDKRIVHRDLKPENLFITRDGRVKILDFGLAKLVQPESARAADAPTATFSTEPGGVMGTPGYMSPEQVRAQAVDHRSDIFAFGAILYEMLSGRAAFSGDSSVERLNAILKEEPPELPEEAKIPQAMARILQRCLEKQPEDRFQSTRDLVFHLESLSSQSGPQPPAAPALRRRPSFLYLGVGVVALAALGFKAGQYLEGRAETPLAFKQLSYHTGVITAARFAPDGETILYSAAWDGSPTQVYTTRVDGKGSRSMGLPRAGLWAVSSTGELAVALGCIMNWAECIGTLGRVPLAGGAPRAVLEEVLGAEWSPDGQKLAIVRFAEGQYRLEYPPGEVIYQTPGWIVCPRISPKGDWIAFIEHPKFGDAAGSLKAVRLETKQVKPLLSDNWTVVVTLAWRPDGEEIWFGGARNRQRMAINGVSLDGAVRVVYDGPGSIRIHDVTSKGRSLVSVVHPRGHLFLQGAGMAQERSLSWLDWTTSADLSADGKTLLFFEWGEGVSAKPTIYLRNTDGSDPVRLGEGKPLALSPDGKWVVAIDNGVPSHLVLLPTGAGEARHLPRGSVQEFWWATWFADSKRILFAGNESDRPQSYVQDIDGTAEPKPILRAGLAASLVLPDGKRVVAENLLDGSHSLWPLEGGDPERIPGIQQGEEVLAWAPDGKSYWLRSTDATIIRLYRVDASTGRRTLWKEIAPPPTGMAGFAPERGGVRITPDGKSWVYSYWSLFHELYVVDGLR